jgi:alpha-ketoglutarate-dependent 2,4-dichlorophenoxyacetate dioxygenase
MLDITQLHPLFVGKVNGIDLRRPVDDAARQALVAASDRYAVLVFRDQDIDDDQQAAFTEGFGALGLPTYVLHPGYKMRLDPRIVDVSNLDEKHAVLDPDDRRRKQLLGNRLWHTDNAFRPIPARYSMLSARAVPDRGGETEFADMRAAWDALPDEKKTQVEGLIGMHSLHYSRATLGFHDYSQEERDGLPSAPHPLVRTHPGSGRKALFLASYVHDIRGMDTPDARVLMHDLIEHATQRQFVYSHSWRVGDLVMWDNRCLMHRVREYDMTQPRDMRRTTVMETEPTVKEA